MSIDSSLEGVSLRSLRSLDELSAVRDAWLALQWHPFGDFDYFLTQRAPTDEFLRPNVLSVERDGQIVGLVAATLHEESIPWRIGSFALLHGRARVLRVGSADVMGESSTACARAVMTELLACLARGDADVVYLHQIDASAPLLAEARQMSGILTRDHFARPVPGWFLEVPPTFEEYMKSRSKSVRNNLKYYANRIQRQLPEVRVVCYRKMDELDRLTRDCATVAARTYQHRIGVAFADTPATRRFLTHALTAGWLYAYVLYTGEQPIAFWHGLAYRGTFFTRETGFDPDFAELRPGNFLLAKIIEELCVGGVTRKVDFGVMDAEYKRHFGSLRTEFVSCYVFARRPRGLALALMRAATGGAERLARTVFGSERLRRLARNVRIRSRSGREST